MKAKIFVLTILLALMTSACQASGPTEVAQAPSPTIKGDLPSETARPTNTATLLPSATVTALATSILTLTSTATVAPSITPTATPNFSQAKIMFAIPRPFGLWFDFYVPGLKTLYRVTLGGVEFTCSLQEGYDQHIFCYGPAFPAEKSFNVVFYAPNATEPAFKQAFVLTATPTIVELPGECKIRGINVKCETENRIGPDGPCIVSTCVDRCGYYYSIMTCPPDMILPKG